MGRVASTIEAAVPAIVDRFLERLQRSTAAASLPSSALIDSLPAFLDGLVQKLRDVETEVENDGKSASSTHGEQRLALGYDFATTLREYATVRDLVFEAIEERSVELSLSEMLTISRYLMGGVIDAALAYADAREEQLRRQTAKHVGFLAHEVRNPLQTLRFAVARLRTELPAENRSIGTAERALRTVSTLIDDALVDVRMKGGPDVQPSRLSLREMVTLLEEDYEPEASAKSIKVADELKCDTIVADAKMLRSALSNLIGNAVKFTHPGGGVHIRARCADERVVIEVEDGCGGLPPGNVEKLFDPFVQLGKDRSGFGLGLAIAKQVAEAHGGTLRVHDLTPHGCVFVLDLPARQEPAT